MAESAGTQRVRQALAHCPLYFILDESLCAERDPVQLAATVVAAGVRLVQLRFKSLPTGDLALLGAEVLDAIRPAGALLLVNDDLAAALACSADGVHLGAGDMSIAAAREQAPALIIGGTARTPEAARAAAAAGADTVGSGSVFASATKPGLPTIGCSGLADVVAGVDIPVTAIGGIDATNCAAVMSAGAAGFTAIAPFGRNLDAAAVVLELVSAAR